MNEGEKAKESLNTVLDKSTSPNLFGLHPPFQMDANFGVTAGIAEMLIQSHDGSIRFLPALPAEWSTGEVKGLKARGGFEVDIKWHEGELVSAQILSKSQNRVTIKYKNHKETLRLEVNEKTTFKMN